MRILIVEDNPDYSELLAEWLQEYTITKANSLAQALEIYNDEIDVILFDMGLPDSEGMDGVETIGAATNTPIIVLTGEDLALSPDKCVQSGGLSFIRKGDLRSPWPLISAIQFSVTIGTLINEVEAERAEYKAKFEVLAKGIGHYWTRMVRDFSILYEFAREKIDLGTLDQHLNEPHGILPEEKEVQKLKTEIESLRAERARLEENRTSVL